MLGEPSSVRVIGHSYGPESGVVEHQSQHKHHHNQDEDDTKSVDEINISEEHYSEGEGSVDEDEKTWVRVVVISDTHTHHPKIVLPKGDVLIHCGDYCKKSTIQQVSIFNEWLGTTKFPIKIVIAGNHETVLDRLRDTPKDIQSLFSNATYLQDSGMTLFDGKVSVWGSPWISRSKMLLYSATKDFSSMIGFGLAFALPGEDTELEEKRKMIPTGVDWLITHSPPFEILDYNLKHRVGCKYLRNEVINRVKPRVHVFGHNHYGFGTEQHPDTLFINAALENGEHWAKPMKFKYCLETKEVVLLKYDKKDDDDVLPNTKVL